jgi:hypothetical protein
MSDAILVEACTEAHLQLKVRPLLHSFPVVLANLVRLTPSYLREVLDIDSVNASVAKPLG